MLLVSLIALAALPAMAGKKKPPPYALIIGTVYGPDERPLYGVPVKIRRAQDKKPRWELMSDHRGEFAQRVPPGPADYIISTDFRLEGKKKGQKPTEVRVRVEGDERVDTGLHLTE